jgi:RND family efflux transporter MFP subunit
MPRFFSLSVSVVLLVGVVAFTSGCGGQSSDSAAAPTERPTTRVETLVLEPAPFTDIIEVTGTVEALDDAVVSSQTDGRVTMLRERGTRVRDGDLVATINAEEAEAAVEQARAQYELAQDRFDRQQPLYRDSVISALEFEQVRSERNQARAALSQAETRLENAQVEAPFAGTVEERFIEEGEQAAPGTRLARIVNTRRVKVTAGIPERYANDIEIGTPIQLDFRRYGAGVRTAEVTFAGSTIDPESRTFSIEATLSNEEGTLKPEMSTRLRVTRAVLDDALVLPRTAVLRDETGPHVYVANRSDSVTVAENRDISIGAEAGNHVVVDSGLTAGDEIIVVGQNNASPGAPLEIIEQRTRAPETAPSLGGDSTLPTPPQTD